MKKNVIIALIGIVLVTLLSCGEKKITVKGADGKEYSTYQQACRAGDFDAAWAYVDELEKRAMDLTDGNWYEKEDVIAYTSGRDYVFNAEVQQLFSFGSTEASDRILYLLNNLPIKGRRLEEGYKGSDATTKINVASKSDFAWFCESVNSYNNKCRQIMELCVSHNNKYLAEKIVKLVKETPNASEYASQWTVYYTQNDIRVVKKMYDEAFGVEEQKDIVEDEKETSKVTSKETPNKSKKKRRK